MIGIPVLAPSSIINRRIWVLTYTNTTTFNLTMGNDYKAWNNIYTAPVVSILDRTHIMGDIPLATTAGSIRQNQNGVFFQPGRMYDLPRKFGVGTTYLRLWELSYPTRPTALELSRESNVGWEYAAKVMSEIHQWRGYSNNGESISNGMDWFSGSIEKPRKGIHHPIAHRERKASLATQGLFEPSPPPLRSARLIDRSAQWQDCIYIFKAKHTNMLPVVVCIIEPHTSLLQAIAQFRMIASSRLIVLLVCLKIRLLCLIDNYFYSTILAYSIICNQPSVMPCTAQWALSWSSRGSFVWVA